MLTSYTRVTYDNYNTTKINEITFLQLIYNYYIGVLWNYPTTSYNNNFIINYLKKYEKIFLFYVRLA